MEAQYVIPQDTFSQMYNGIISGILQGMLSAQGGGTMPPASGIDDSTSGDTAGGTGSETPTPNPGEGGTTPPVGEITEPVIMLMNGMIDPMVDTIVKQDMIVSSSKEIAVAMTEATMQKTILTKVGELTGKLMETMGNAFNVNPDKIANAFKFEMSEEEMRRLFETLSSGAAVENADTNLLSLGYQDLDEPTTISFYFKDFDSKEKFIDFIDEYNEKMEKEDEEKVLNYADITGLLMSSVKTIVDSVSYVLIAFVSISLIVSSIMIGIITYISVLERTKELGV